MSDGRIVRIRYEDQAFEDLAEYGDSVSPPHGAELDRPFPGARILGAIFDGDGFVSVTWATHSLLLPEE